MMECNREERGDRGFDFNVLNAGTIVMFTPITDEAQAWWKEWIDWESAQMLGNSYSVEHRYAPAIVEGLIAAGFRPCITVGG